MMQDPRSREKLRDFFHLWLKTEEAAEATKDQQQFPGFNKQVATDLRQSLDLFLDEVVWGESSDFRQLFLADFLILNKRLGEYYQIKTEKDGFQKVSVDPTKRSGVLTHPYLMSGFAYHSESSPVHRGVFIARNLLGRSLKQPAKAIPPLTEEFDPTMTTRERVEHQTKEVACMACHSVINPLGFSLENYDAVGRFRTKDKEKPINVTSIYETPSGDSVTFSGARDLANYLANSTSAQKSFVRRVFHQYTNQSIYAYGDEALDRFHRQFVDNDFSIQLLIIEIAKFVIENQVSTSTNQDKP